MTLQDRLAFYEQLKQTNNTSTKSQPTTSEEVVSPPERVSVIRESFLQTDSVAKNISTPVNSYTNANGGRKYGPSKETKIVPSAFQQEAVRPHTSSTSKPSATSGSVSKPSASSGSPSNTNKSSSSNNSTCSICNKTVYFMEQILIDDKPLHKTCLKCDHCKMGLKIGNYAALEGKYYCKPHFQYLFKLKGNYFEGFGKEEHKKQWQSNEEKKE